jgi:hypothetical protein
MCQEDLTAIRGLLRGGLAALAAFVAVAPGLAACGGDDLPAQETAPAVTGAEEDESTIDRMGEQQSAGRTLKLVLATPDEVLCSELLTERFVRRSYGDLAGCEAALKTSEPAKDSGVLHVGVSDGSVAQVLASPDGGVYDGQKLRAELVLESGKWKLDSLRSNVPVGP